ncbi:hypothetical protein Tco_1269490 [Tanacetum coccineum]
MENPEQAFVDYASSRNNKEGGKPFTTNQGPRNFNEATNAWKDKPNFNWARTQNFSSPQNGSFSTYSSNMPSGPSSYQTKLERVLKDFDSHQEKRLKIDNAPTRDIAKDSMACVNAVSHDHLGNGAPPNKGIKKPNVIKDNNHNTIAEIKEKVGGELSGSEIVIGEGESRDIKRDDLDDRARGDTKEVNEVDEENKESEEEDDP